MSASPSFNEHKYSDQASSRPKTPPRSSSVIESTLSAVQATPHKPKAHNSVDKAASGVNVKATKKKDIHGTVKKEIMGAILPNVEGLAQKRFPDALFDRLLGDDKEPIILVRDPHQPPTPSAQNEAPTESQSDSGDNDVVSPSLDERATSSVETPDANSIRAVPPVSEQDAPEEPTEPTAEPRRSSRFLPSLPSFLKPSKKADPPPPKTTLEEIFDSMKGSHRLYNGKNKKWRKWPKTNKQNKENEVAEYLNKIVEAARVHLNERQKVLPSDKDRVFSAKYANSPVEYDGEQRKPDIVLIPREGLSDSGEKKGGWKNINAVGELKSNRNFSVNELADDLAEYARLCFGSQRARRFALAFSLCDTKLRLWKYGRTGVLASKEIDVHKQPLDFLRVILGLALGDDYYLGLDPSFFSKDGKDYVKLNDEEYEIIKEICINNVIRGRGTVALVVMDKDGNISVMKDQWVDRSRPTKEPDMLGILDENDMQNVIALVDYQYVHFKVDGDDPVLDTTESDIDSDDMQKVVEGLGVETRDHIRLLIRPFGDDIGSFRSLKELVSAFRDYIHVIQRLLEIDIVHRDISNNNVILVKSHDSPMRKGYLIDFDFAILQSRTHIAQAERTGTYPFMAREVLRNRRITHQYYHDIESVFYVLIWVCLVQDGPENKQRVHSSAEPSPLRKWWQSPETDEDMENLAVMKNGMLLTEKEFQGTILRHFPVYFEPLKNLLLGLRRIIVDNVPETALYPGEEISGEPKPINDRDYKRVFFSIDALFEEELAKLPDDSQTLFVVEATEPSAPIAVEATVRGSAQRAEKESASDTDSGVTYVSSTLFHQPAMIPYTLTSRKQPVTYTSTTDGTSELHRQAIMNSAKAWSSCGEKRGHDWEEDEKPQAGLMTSSSSSSSSKRPRRRR